MKEIGVGVIGYGFMGNTHTYGYKTIPFYYKNLPFRIKLIGICDAVEETARNAKETQGFEFYTTNPEDIFAREDIEVVNVCTPNIYHKQDVLGALKAGKHVYCDKPLVTSSEEAKEVIEAAKASGLITQMALQYRFFPATMRAKELIEEGRLGQVFSFRAAYLHSSATDPNKALGWKQDKKFGGGGVLFDLGSHVLDLLYSFLGEYESIFAKTQIVYPQRPDKSGNMVQATADDTAFMLVKTKSGAMGTVEASKMATGVDDELRFEIHGSKGAIRFNHMTPNYLEFYDNTIPEEHYGGNKGFTRIESVQRFKVPGNGFPNPRFSLGWLRAHVHCLYSFLDSVYSGKPAAPTFEEGAYIQYVMEKAYESDRLGQWVNL